MASTSMNWAAIDADPRFQELHARKSRFLWGLMAFSVVYYFLLPIGAAYFTDLYKHQGVGRRSTSGSLFALSQFIVAWGIAWSICAQGQPVRRHGRRRSPATRSDDQGPQMSNQHAVTQPAVVAPASAARRRARRSRRRSRREWSS